MNPLDWIDNIGDFIDDLLDDRHILTQMCILLPIAAIGGTIFAALAYAIGALVLYLILGI